MRRKLGIITAFIIGINPLIDAHAGCPLSSAVSICLDPALSSASVEKLANEKGFSITGSVGLGKGSLPKTGSFAVRSKDGYEFVAFATEFADMQLMDCSLNVISVSSSTCSPDDLVKFEQQLRGLPNTSLETSIGEGGSHSYFIRSPNFWARVGVLAPPVGPSNVLVTRARIPQ